jgi:hypothetical protein
VLLLVGDDWAQDHHDVELMDQAGRTLARARLAEGAAGMARLHALIGEHLGRGDDDDNAVVRVGIETDRGLWVGALVAAGYEVFGVNPLQAARYRERHVVSGAKSDTGDAHMLADLVRTDARQLRQVAAGSPAVQAVKVVARLHKTLIWEQARQVTRLGYQLRDFFPAALDAYESLGLDAPDVLELLGKAPDPASAAKLTTAQVDAALKRARRHHRADKTAAIRAALRAPQLAAPGPVTAAGAAAVRALAAVIATLSEQITTLEGQVEEHFRQHPDADIIRSQPGPGPVLGARVLAEFGDDPHRYATAKAQELRRHQPDHPPVRQRPLRAGPVRPQRPAPRRPAAAGLRRPAAITRRQGLLRRAPRPQDGTRGRPARQQAHGHPARLPQNPHPLRRGHRMATLPNAILGRRLTSTAAGMSRGSNSNLTPHGVWRNRRGRGR